MTLGVVLLSLSFPWSAPSSPALSAVPLDEGSLRGEFLLQVAYERDRHEHFMTSTVMNYFSFEEAARIGREVVAARGPALEYDRLVVRDVYLDEPVPGALPAFCTDHQAGCSPFKAKRHAVGAAKSVAAGMQPP